MRIYLVNIIRGKKSFMPAQEWETVGTSLVLPGGLVLVPAYPPKEKAL